MDDFEDFVDIGPERYSPSEYNSLGKGVNLVETIMTIISEAKE